jgi:hypothetical protein
MYDGHSPGLTQRYINTYHHNYFHMVTEFILYTTSNMASSSITTTIPTSFSIPISEKLTKANYYLWHAQILPSIRATQMEDLLLGVEKKPPKLITEKADDSTTEKTNPKYIAWLARDQALLGYLLSSLT